MYEPTVWEEVFFALFPCVLRAPEAMSNEQQFVNLFWETAWNRDTDNKSSIQFLLHNRLSYNDEMPFYVEATQYQATIQPHQRF